MGTSGGLHSNLHTVITSYCLGFEQTGPFYNVPYPDAFARILEERVNAVIDDAIPHTSRFKGWIRAYASKADGDVMQALAMAAHDLQIPYDIGITVSNSGFFNNQGRTMSRIPRTVEDFYRILGRLDTGIGYRVLNMEMEGSFLFHWATGLDCRAGMICAAIADRYDETFQTGYHDPVMDAARAAITALYRLQENQ